ncbi:MAG: TonB-dependent receptor, partial [Niveispirillum sp.]|nr:TonB-dependent receptor [Niveispirillum sp.]
MNMNSHVEVRGLCVTAGATSIVADVDFSIPRGGVLALIGESGSGKTTIAMALMGYARLGCCIAGGSVRVGEAWQVVANYAWTDAKADDKAFATDNVLNVPEHSGSLFVVGRFATTHGTDWSMTAGAAYVGDRAATLTTDGVRLPAYWKAKAAVEYGLTPQVTARVEVDNLLD